MFKGAKSIKMLSFLTGCAIGQLTSTLLYDNLKDFISLSEGDFTLAVTFGCGVILFMIGQFDVIGSYSLHFIACDAVACFNG